MAEDKETKKTSSSSSSGRSPQRGQPGDGDGGGGGDGRTRETAFKEPAVSAPCKSRRLAGIRSRISIEELKSAYRRQVSLSQEDTADPVFDPMAKAQESLGVVRGRTGVVYSRQDMTRHACLWDPKHQESPDRLTSILDRCQALGLLEECERLQCRAATEEEVLLWHSPAHLSLLQTTAGATQEDKLEDLASRFDAIYLHPATYESALLAAGSTLDLVDAVAAGRLHNGFAIVRPPGHHAMESEFCGYCYLNNVVLAARHALATHGLSRILVIDWDVHHGQATQQAFYNDPRVLYFSIHRYEQGSYWPCLRESNYDYIGEGAGRGYNFNLPLNTTGMANQDFLAILHQVLLPVAYEFSPELVIVSAGYDAALGCPEGEMEVSPGLYAHLTSHLMALAGGKVAVVLEGGYCLESLAEGAAMTLSTLLGRPCPPLMDPITQPSPSLQESVLSLVYVQRPYWKCFQYQGSFSLGEVRGEDDPRVFTPSLSFRGHTGARPLRFPTRDPLPPRPPETLKKIADKLLCLRQKEVVRPPPGSRLCLVYDQGMEQHHSLTEGEHPERPERIRRVWEMLGRAGVVQRSTVLQSRVAQREEVALVHTQEHVDFMFGLEGLGEEALQTLQESYKSVYLHPKTNACALLSAGCLLQVVEEVMAGGARAGVAVIRPPGHHAEPDRPHGFCFYNNVAVAARHATHNLGCQRVLIVDWDVHHGNGIQHAFEDDPRVLYMSLHRYDHGMFFPSSEDANFDRVGTGAGQGYTINIPWNKSGMGDAEYMAAFCQVVMPVAYQFDPQLVVVAAGFDAARGDPLGGCRVSPECYGHMTSLLSGLAEGRVVLALEGGYNLTSISYCMTLCAKVLLGDPPPPLEAQLVPNKNAVRALNYVISTHSQYWSALCFQVDLPLQDVLHQGCGGGPQGTDSGLSGSEHSLSPSRRSPSPHYKSSPDSSPSTTATTSPYVSAPSSPAKPMLPGEAVQDAREGLPSPVGARPRTQCQATSPPRTPHTPRQQESERPVSGAGARCSPRKRGRDVGEAMQAAVASQGRVKGPTAVLAAGSAEPGSAVHGVVVLCERTVLWEACTVLPPQQPLKADSLPTELLTPLSPASVVAEGCLVAGGGVAALVEGVLEGSMQNGLAVVPSVCGRPSGVALALHSLLHSRGTGTRVLLVDWDSCEGEGGAGMQDMFVQEPRVLVVSLRQCQVASGPRAKQSAGQGVGIDLQGSALEHQSDWHSLAHQVLLPLAYEFRPDVVVMAAASEWTGNSAFLALMAQLLMPVAGGRLVVAVGVDHQGSEAAAGAVAVALHTLLGGPPEPSTARPLPGPSPEVCRAVLGVMRAQQGAWQTLRHHTLASLVTPGAGQHQTPPPRHHHTTTTTTTKHHQDTASPPPPLTSPEWLRQGPWGVCLVYSVDMKQHLSYADATHPETPDRISCIYKQLRNFGLVDRCHSLKAREATSRELERVHSLRHIKFMSGLHAKKPSELLQLEDSFDSIYLHRRTNPSALLAAGSLLAAVDSVVLGQSRHGVAVIRPPGHHAERNKPCGFCLYNSVAVAAQHAISRYRLERVLVLDWDVHHGNGTQHMFESDPRVLYVSLHRYDHGKFFPGSPDANYHHVGVKRGRGYNINIPWNKGGMGDAEYLAAFLQVVLPVATQFRPQLVLVSAGFDAAVGDPLGGCNVTPECYGHMTKFLTGVGDGRVIVALEGGYNLTSISYCMTLCAKALLGDPLPCLSGPLVPCQSALVTLTNVLNTHCKFWSCLQFKDEATTVVASRTPDSPMSPSLTPAPPTTTTTTTPQGMDELAASLSRVSMSEAATPMTPPEEEASTGELEGACGGSSQGGATTLILAENLGAEQLYAVVPASWCPHLEEVRPVPGGAITTTAPCQECHDTSENWCCLTCYKVLCGRFVAEHMLMHGLCEQHHMVLSFSDLSAWCYACDTYVHHHTLFEAKRAAHLDKFGEEPPDCS